MDRDAKHRSGVKADTVLVLGLAALLCSVLIALDAFDRFSNFAAAHEDWEMDEIFTGFVCLGLSGFYIALRRTREARRELRRRLELQSSATWQATHDALTDLPNRQFLANFSKEVDAAPDPRRYSLLLLNLTGFKKLNDTFGHAQADSLLCQIAERLREAAPRDLLLRFGGNEFLVITEHVAQAEISQLANELHEAVSKPLRLQSGTQITPGVVIGIAQFPADAQDLETAAHRAGIAVNAARRNGTNWLSRYDENMRNMMDKDVLLEQALPEAIKSGQIVPHFQPLVDLNTGKILAFEVLARWFCPDGRTISPLEFIPIAERTGLIGELSENLLRQACSIAMNWPANIGLSFNLSPVQLGDDVIGLRIVRILGEVGFMPSRLEIEITESGVIQDMDRAAKIISDLHAAGIKVAMDDFGTGYSSLSTLSRFPFDCIKIDRSFVTAFKSDGRQRRIVRAIVSMGHELDMTVTVEGIEEPDQLEAFRMLQCEVGQGYFFGRPEPAEMIEQRLGLRHKSAEGVA